VPGLETRVADTTGAGDAFAAGFLTGMAQGWDLPRCGLFGNAVGALCVQEVGATTGVRSMAETVSFAQAQGRW
jgi:sugar/nucleoside kinase (ribokinase family)